MEEHFVERWWASARQAQGGGAPIERLWLLTGPVPRGERGVAAPQLHHPPVEGSRTGRLLSLPLVRPCVWRCAAAVHCHGEASPTSLGGGVPGLLQRRVLVLLLVGDDQLLW